MAKAKRGWSWFEMHDAHLKRKALELREGGMTLDDITLRLALPRTTIYYWLRDLPLEGRTAKQSAARQRASDANRDQAARKRELTYNQAWEAAPQLMENPLFRDFIVLYMAEGYRRNRNSVCLANSNPHIIVLSNTFIRRFATNRVYYSLQYHVDHEPEELVAYWSTLLDANPASFVLSRKSNSGQLAKRQWRSEYGVLSVKCDDTSLRSKIQAWMDFVTQSWQTK